MMVWCRCHGDDDDDDDGAIGGARWEKCGDEDGDGVQMKCWWMRVVGLVVMAVVGVVGSDRSVWFPGASEKFKYRGYEWMEMKVGMAAAVGGVVAAAAAAVGGDEVAVAHEDDDGVIGWKGRRWCRDGVAAVVWQ
ncbi:hypothetical protein Tco_0322310 [Tanacetum coccineum]